MARCIGPKLAFEPRSLVPGCQGALQRAATTATRPRLAPLLVASRAGKAADVPLAGAEPDSPPARDATSTTTSTSTAPGLGSSAAESPHDHEVAAPGPASGSRGPSLSPAKASSSSPSPGASRPSSASPGAGGSPAGPGGPGGSGSSPPGGGVDGLRLRYWLVLLVEYGGIYGTAAVVLSALTGVPAFGPGGVRWEAADVGLGLALMAPALALDALVGLPDWSTRREEDARQLVRLFVDPEALAAERKARQGAKGSGGDSSSTAAPLASTTNTSAATTAAEDATAAAVGEAARLLASAAAAAELSSAAAAEEEAQAAGRADSGASASTSSASGDSSSSSGDAAPSPVWAALQRLRMALELMQETSIRNNPGARLTPLQELAVIVVAVTADEMLYRAVLLTLVGRWLRDRFYEAGADDTLLLSLPWGGGSGSLVELDTGSAGLWAALFLGCAAGAGVFAGRAWQEATLANRLQAVQAAQREALEQQLKRQRLGTHMTAEEVRQRQEQQARLEALQTNFASSVGVQGALVWLLEGAREVYQVAAAGGAFIITGNLAAPLAGGLAAQCLLSAYQRLGLRRSMERRAEVMRRRKAKAKEREMHRLRQEAAAKELAARAEEEAAEAAARAKQGQAGEATEDVEGQGSRQLEGAAAAVGPAREQQQEREQQEQPQPTGVNGHKSNEA